MKYYKSTIEENKFNVTFAVYFVIAIVLCVYVSLELGLIGIAIGIVLLTYEAGVEIDKSKGKFRNYIRVLGYTFGVWRILPEIEYISVVRYLASVGESASGMAEAYDKKYKLNFAVNDKCRIVKLRTMKKEVAIEEAMNIGNAFDLKVYDCTSHNKKWLR